MASFVEDLFSLKGRKGIVTGASRGIGLAIARELCSAGASVFGLARHEPEEEIGNGFAFVKADLLNRESLERAVSGIVPEGQALDFLVNNAGVSAKARAEDFPEEELERVLRTDLSSAFTLCSICHPHLKLSAHQGRIVSISSMGAYMGFSGVTPYCMAKSGVLGLTRGLAEEWKGDGILVNSVAPGWVETALNAKFFKENPQRKAAALAKSMLPRFARPEEVAHAVLFLLGDGARYITGQDIRVDGGAVSHGF